MDNIRGIALDALVEAEGGSSEGLIRDVLNKYDYLDQRDKAFIKLLFEGTMHRLITLDFILDRKSTVKVRKMRPIIRNILRLGLYQLLFTDSPSYAVVKESVELARKRGFKQLSGFVNGILRAFSGEIEESGKAIGERHMIFLPDELKEDRAGYLSIKYSCPDFICRLFISEHGDVAENLLKALEKTRSLSLRFRSGFSEDKINNVILKMSEMNIELRQDAELPFLYHAFHTGDIRRLPGYEEGFFYVQDKSSIKAVMALGIREGETILDCCAAPGGKSMLSSELTGPSGMVCSFDVSENKKAIIEENTYRLKAENVKVGIRDATIHFPEDDEKYDSVILDVPCSGLGVMGRKRDIAVNLKEEELDSILELQRKIIDACAGYVKKGGKLLYSTCTIRRAENEEQVKYICEKHGFEILNEPVQLMPYEGEQDGFFYAVLKRI